MRSSYPIPPLFPPPHQKLLPWRVSEEISVGGSRWAEKQLTSEKGPRFTSCDTPECERWGGVGGWLLSALIYLWERLVCSPRPHGYTCLNFHFLPFENPSSSTFGFLSSEEEFLRAQNFLSYLLLFFSPFSLLQMLGFGQPKIKVARPGMALPGGWRWLADSPAELSHGVSPELGHGFSLLCFGCFQHLGGFLGSEEKVGRGLLLFPVSRPRMDSQNSRKLFICLYLKITRNGHFKNNCLALNIPIAGEVFWVSNLKSKLWPKAFI